MKFEKSFKSYSNDQWLLYKEQTWFDMIDILYVLMLNQNIIDETILITLRNRVIERLNQTNNDFSNIWGIITTFFILVKKGPSHPGFYHSLKTQLGPISQPWTREQNRSGWKNRGRKNPVATCWLLFFFFLLKRHHFDFFKKYWTVRPGQNSKPRP